MRILITGGAGYIGTELVWSLVEQDIVSEIIVYDNLSRSNYNLFLGRPLNNGHKVRVINGDLLDSRKIRKALVGVDVVYHLAAKVNAPFASSDSHYYEQINHWGTAELVYAVEESNASKFIYMSSTSVYGPSENEAHNEESTPSPRTFYGASKLRGEEHFLPLLKKPGNYILRCGNVYGYSKSMRFEAVINKFMFDANFSNRISIHGNGKQERGFVHIDVMSKVLTDLLTEEVPSGIYNLVERNLQVLDIVDAVKDIYPQLEFIFINQHLSLKNLSVDPDSKLREFLTYGQEVTLIEQLTAFKKGFSF